MLGRERQGLGEMHRRLRCRLRLLSRQKKIHWHILRKENKENTSEPKMTAKTKRRERDEAKPRRVKPAVALKMAE